MPQGIQLSYQSTKFYNQINHQTSRNKTGIHAFALYKNGYEKIHQQKYHGTISEDPHGFAASDLIRFESSQPPLSLPCDDQLVTHPLGFSFTDNL